MSKSKFIFATLLPRDLERCEEECVGRVLKEWDKFKDGYESLRIIIGSAHKKSLTKAKAMLPDKYKETAELIHCPFNYTEQMSEIRAHEIGFCKRFLHQYILDMCYEHFLYWIDSDMYISFGDVDRWVKKLTHSSFFITFPYCVRNGLAAPPEQFGAYVINTARLTPDTLKTMYQTNFKKNTICRIGAPDCEFKKALLKAGGKEFRAEDITSEHYSDVESNIENIRYKYTYDKGKCFRSKW